MKIKSQKIDGVKNLFPEYQYDSAKSKHVELVSHRDVDCTKTSYENVTIHNVVDVKTRTRTHNMDGRKFKCKTLEIYTADGRTVDIKLFS